MDNYFKIEYIFKEPYLSRNGIKVRKKYDYKPFSIRFKREEGKTHIIDIEELDMTKQSSIDIVSIIRKRNCPPTLWEVYKDPYFKAVNLQRQEFLTFFKPKRYMLSWNLAKGKNKHDFRIDHYSCTNGEESKLVYQKIIHNFNVTASAQNILKLINSVIFPEGLNIEKLKNIIKLYKTEPTNSEQRSSYFYEEISDEPSRIESIRNTHGYIMNDKKEKLIKIGRDAYKKV